MDLAQLKKSYRFIYCTPFENRLIYWRPLTLEEHDIYMKIIGLGLVGESKLQDQIFREIVLDPLLVDEMNTTPPGLVPSIVNAAFFISGNLLNTEDDMHRMNSDLEQARQAVSSNPYEQFILLICKAFPTYTPSDIEKLEYTEMLRLLVMAEQIVGLEDPIKLAPSKPDRLTDRLFYDRKEAENVDYGRPSAQNIHELLQDKQKESLSLKQAKQIEMENRLRERRSR